MPTQVFQISRAPEAEPLTAEKMKQWLWKNRPDTEWEVRDVLFFRDRYRDALLEISNLDTGDPWKTYQKMQEIAEQALAGK